MIRLVAMYYCQPGQGDAVAAQLKRMAPLLKQREAGCALYHACRSEDNPDLALLYEHDVDQAALEAHRETQPVKAIIEGTIIPLLRKRLRFLYDFVVD